MKSSFKAVIVDDEKLAREDLKVLLNNFNEIDIIGEAETANEAKTIINTLNPDLIFLDIQMPGKSGFDLLEEIETKATIIFVTAYDEYAIHAFEVNAQDYLLKPVNAERLSLAIDHLKSKDKNNSYSPKQMKLDDHIFLLINNSYQFLKVSTIIKIISAGNYSEIHTTKKIKGLVQKSLKDWEKTLPENHFVRIHRNAIINLDCVDHVEEWFNYSHQVYLKGMDKPLVMSRRYATKLKNKIF